MRTLCWVNSQIEIPSTTSPRPAMTFSTQWTKLRLSLLPFSFLSLGGTKMRIKFAVVAGLFIHPFPLPAFSPLLMNWNGVKWMEGKFELTEYLASRLTGQLRSTNSDPEWTVRLVPLNVALSMSKNGPSSPLIPSTSSAKQKHVQSKQGF